MCAPLPLSQMGEGVDAVSVLKETAESEDLKGQAQYKHQQELWVHLMRKRSACDRGDQVRTLALSGSHFSHSNKQNSREDQRLTATCIYLKKKVISGGHMQSFGKIEDQSIAVFSYICIGYNKNIFKLSVSRVWFKESWDNSLTRCEVEKGVLS